MTTPMPAPNFPAIEPGSGIFTTPWTLYLKQFSVQPGPIVAVAVGASPFAYKAAANGSIIITGGTVSSITLTRSTTTIAVGTPLAVANKDLVTITYTVAPTVSFVPR